MTKKLAVVVLLLGVLLAADISSSLPASAATVRPFLSTTLSSFVRFTSTVTYDFSPSVLSSIDGKSWVFWTSAPLSNSFNGTIDYRINNGFSWSADQVAVQGQTCGVTCSPPVQNVRPAAAQLKNGTIYLSYSSNRTGSFEVFLKRFNSSPGWSADYQLTNAPGDELDSTILAASDGSLWVFYDRQTSAGTNIYYRVNRNGSWSSEAALTSDPLPVRDQEPAVFQARDGKIWAIWSQALDTLQITVHIEYATFNGATWSAPVQLTSSSSPDSGPSGIQDSNGTIWIAWSRNLPYFCPGGGCFQHDLFYITSTNNGAGWSAETALTNDTTCVDPFCFDDLQPSLGQFRDSRVYVFWRTNRDPDGFWNIYYVSTNTIPYHNVAVTKITAGPSTLRVGRLLTVNVTVANTGAFSENFQLNVLFTNKTAFNAGTKTLTLASSLTNTYTFVWNTSAAPYGKYVVSANIPPVPYEFITTDNNMTGPRIILTLRGDVNLDGRVDVLDVARVAYSFGSVPGNPNWDPASDLTYDGRIDILDVAIVAFWFGKSV